MIFRTALLAAALLALASGARAADTCDRACLKGFLDGYFNALIAHDPKALPIAPNVKVTENGEPLKLGEGLWKTAGPTTYRLEVFDPETGGAAAQSVLKEGDALSLHHVRLKVAGGKITEIETIVARKGVASGVVWGPENLTAVSPAFQLSIRPAERDSRYTLMAAADAYFHAFETNGTPEYRPAPFLPDTQRYENGLRTTNAKVASFPAATAAEAFDRGMFKGRRLFDRRFPVVDEERGIVLAMVRIGQKTGPDAPAVINGLEPLLAYAFAVKGGRIQEIVVVMTAKPAGTPTGW